MRNWVKYLVGFLFILSCALYLFIQFNISKSNIEFKVDSFNTLHNINIFFIFPFLSTLVLMYFYRKRKVQKLLDYITTWIIISFFVITISEFLMWNFGGYFDRKDVYFHPQTNQTISSAICGGGAISGDYNVFLLNSPYLLIFNKYEEIDTNTLDLTHWKRL